MAQPFFFFFIGNINIFFLFYFFFFFLGGGATGGRRLRSYHHIISYHIISNHAQPALPITCISNVSKYVMVCLKITRSALRFTVYTTFLFWGYHQVYYSYPYSPRMGNEWPRCEIMQSTRFAGTTCVLIPTPLSTSISMRVGVMQQPDYYLNPLAYSICPFRAFHAKISIYLSMLSILPKKKKKKKKKINRNIYIYIYKSTEGVWGALGQKKQSALVSAHSLLCSQENLKFLLSFFFFFFFFFFGF